MSQIPPRPSRRPYRTSTFENSTEATPQDGKHNDENEQSKGPSPPPRPSSRPIRIQPADPEAPRYKEKSELHQTLEKLDTPDAALNPDTVRTFEEVRDKLNEEGPGGSTAASIKYPALGLQKSYTFEERPSSTNASKDIGEPEEAITDSVSSPTRDATGGASLSEEESPAAKSVPGSRMPEERSPDIEAKPLSSADSAGELTQISHKTTPPESELSAHPKSDRNTESGADTNNKPEFILHADQSSDEKPSNPKSAHSIQSSEERKILEPEGEFQKSVSSKSSLSDSLAPSSNTISITSNDRNGPSESLAGDSAHEVTKQDDIRPDAKDWSAAEISPKSSDAQGSLEKLLDSSPASQVDSISDVPERSTQDGETSLERESRAASESLESMKVDPHDGASIDSLNSGECNTVTAQKGDSERESEAGSSEGAKLSDGTNLVSSKPNRPSKPLAPKPKSAMAARLEAAFRQSEESKSNIAPKPKPRLGGSGGRIAALQASMFADLNAALTRGPLPGGRPREPSDAEGSPSKTEDYERKPDSRNDLSSQDSRDTAESQIKAMPKLPSSRAAGPNRRRRLPGNAKPKFVIVSPRNPLWEISEPEVCTSSVNSKPGSPTSGAANSNKSDLVPPIGSKTELNLRDAFMRSLSRSDTDPSADGQLGCSDSVSQEPSTKSETDSTEDDILPNFHQLSQRGLPSLGSLVDQSPSPVTTPNDGIKSCPTDTIDDNAPERGDSAGLSNFRLSQYLDKNPLTSESSPNIERMKTTGSYFSASASVPKDSDSESQDTPSTKVNKAAPGLGAIQNDLNHDEVLVEREDVKTPTDEHVLPEND